MKIKSTLHSPHPTSPAFLMARPENLSTDVANNVWMEEIAECERAVELPRAIEQFGTLYRFVARQADVYLLPSAPNLQDQVYVANLGIVLPHLAQRTLVVANFRSEPRRGETAAGLRFFEQMSDYTLHVAPEFFEGEADLKHIVGSVYIGAHGIRTSSAALDWFERTFEMRVIPFEMTDPRLYHLDCCVLPLGPRDVGVCTSMASPGLLRELERHVTVHDVDLVAGYGGLCNSVVLGQQVLCSSNLWELDKGHRYYAVERAKVERLNALCARLGREPAYFNLSEFTKSGAMLSCMLMHFNRHNFAPAATEPLRSGGPFRMPDADGDALPLL